MPPKSSKHRDDPQPQPVAPRYQRAPERGVLCYELLIKHYVQQWLTAKTITPEFYTKARDELEVLQKTKYGKKVAAEKPDPAAVYEVETLPSTPPSAQKPNPSASGGGRGIANRNGQQRHQLSVTTPNDKSRKNEAGAVNKMGQQNHQPTVQPSHQHLSKDGAGVLRGVADKANVTEQKLTLQIINLQNDNRKLTDETTRLYNVVSSLDIEKRELEEKIENLKTQLHGAYENMNDLKLRLSKLAGDNMRSNNPNLADLSDPYRPTEVGKIFGEIYDNEWSDAFEVVRGNTEKDKINILYNILMDTYKFCRDIFQRQTTAIEGCLINPAIIQSEASDANNELKNVEFKNALKDRRKQLAPITAKQLAEVYSKCELPKEQGLDETERLPPKLIKYASKCCELCWFMVISDPPLVFSEERDGNDFVSDIFRPYTRSQKDMVKPVIEMVVWPALYLHFEGALLSKGVAQPMSGKDHNTK